MTDEEMLALPTILYDGSEIKIDYNAHLKLVEAAIVNSNIRVPTVDGKIVTIDPKNAKIIIAAMTDRYNKLAPRVYKVNNKTLYNKVHKVTDPIKVKKVQHAKCDCILEKNRQVFTMERLNAHEKTNTIFNKNIIYGSKAPCGAIIFNEEGAKAVGLIGFKLSSGCNIVDDGNKIYVIPENQNLPSASFEKKYIDYASGRVPMVRAKKVLIDRRTNK